MKSNSRSGWTLSGIQAKADLIAKLQKDRAGCAEICRILEQYAGIRIHVDQKGLIFVANRLGTVLHKRGCPDYFSYIEQITSGRPENVAEFVSALTTNTTHFFREDTHFEHLREYLPDLLKLKHSCGDNDLRIWCAAASTGQEPYSILMTLLETMNGTMAWKIKMLASDIDGVALARTAKAEYSEQEMTAVPSYLRHKYFFSKKRKDELVYQVKPEVAQFVRCAPMNLNDDQYGFKHKFDVIFCRNVLIYFKAETAQRVMQKLTAALAPNGLLYVGHTESALVKIKGLKRISSAVFQREDYALSRAS